MNVDNFASLLSAKLLTVTPDANAPQFIVVTQQQFDPNTGQPAAPITTTINEDEVKALIDQLNNSLANAQAVLAQFPDQQPVPVQPGPLPPQPAPAPAVPA